MLGELQLALNDLARHKISKITPKVQNFSVYFKFFIML
ncbi:hypothetical protein SAMN06295967_11181 [Belliella buryatensis]|uniref:Uncharacterized protein n=1 Tax=Belliella buryatensis TaxID=1500549 RepID=A0A239F2R6_9BACT|nr:hypothetical protein SAMN06295967_11181 [Belliella buryatensis]